LKSWSLSELLGGLHDDIQQRLTTARKTLAHPGTKGDASEGVWLEMLQTYLPQRYRAMKGHVVDSNGDFSDQIDVLVFDRQYSPFIFQYQGQGIIPAESVYGAFEAKQSITAEQVRYAEAKLASVRKLHRTSLPIPTASGLLPPKPLHHIIGGLLTVESDWDTPLGKPLLDALKAGHANGRLDLGCVAVHGIFSCDSDGCHTASLQNKGRRHFCLNSFRASRRVPPCR